MNLTLRCVLILFAFPGIALAQLKPEGHKRLFSDSFDRSLNCKRWIAEIEAKPNSSVYVRDGKLLLDTKGGVTLWFNKLLKGNIEISFTRKVLIDTGKNDRLSDLNVFWMATDPRNRNLFTRNGVFEAYDSLSLYYVGMGGNTNKTTRFRKYDGKGEKPLLQEYVDKAHLLEPNKEYHIKIRAVNGEVSFWVDGTCYFCYKDAKPLKEGFFGFRSTWARQEIDDFKVYRVK